MVFGGVGASASDSLSDVNCVDGASSDSASLASVSVSSVVGSI